MIPKLTIFVYTIRGRKKRIGSNGKRIVGYMNIEAANLINLNEIVFNRHKMIITTPNIDSNNIINVRNHQFNLMYKHEDLEGVYEVSKEREGVFILEKIDDASKTN